ncbi:hypothetical protein C7S18_01165 [Ahniella affigens]|uniref:DUF4440 domain-containing protein n=1 Tax=Ahniella affigens TaxID=2021234 RepID=A0A2P1PM32_9GAMM|nr:nuclear transport factor 2 family protein [Ahniella affigens]AVP95892.1 hypothetical protein C7S18_01165 [Ahniella affigens]
MPHTTWLASVLVPMALSATAALPAPNGAVATAALKARHAERVSVHADPVRIATAAWISDDILVIDADGERRDRSGLQQSLAVLPRFSVLASEQVLVRQFNQAAIVQSLLLGTTDGKPERRRNTDVYVWDSNQWQWVAGQQTRLKPGLPEAIQHADAPQVMPWTGADPSGDPIAVLTALNDAYVDAFRRADVGWYDAHLSQDYVVVFGDGTLHDRPAALADFALPVFAEHLRHFPVGTVQVRRFGNLAVIHAENDYERQDGRKGINRYTDIWVYLKGSWRCVSAHITVYRPPI